MQTGLGKLSIVVMDLDDVEKLVPLQPGTIHQPTHPSTHPHTHLAGTHLLACNTTACPRHAFKVVKSLNAHHSKWPMGQELCPIETSSRLKSPPAGGADNILQASRNRSA